ncbi:L,D-transpeptidase family protein [Sphingomonas sinipercae]|uniref:L,D-transpeptidase family protein n=2 Tax=Sphingomonas sinipercae TaxID=2714944 RepID=A0A6G7ZQS7_9SPHN|nr:L,D-transpeptidase family protein [Sphingomonas sinipercae]
MISAAVLALSGCDNSPIKFNGGDQGESGSPGGERVQQQLRDALKSSIQHGLTTDLFFKGDLGSASESDLRDAVVKLASALAQGKVDPKSTAEVYTVARPKVDVQAGFDKAMSEGKVGEWLASLAPQTPEYQTLSRAFVHYADLASKTPDTNIQPGEPLKPGVKDPRVPAVVAALKAGGYLEAEPQTPEATGATNRPAAAQGGQAAAAPDSYTPAVAAAVKRMQQDFGLKPDGVIGNDTLKAVNTSAKDRARQLAVALERLRWLERTPPATRIDVNTAATTLDYWRDGQHVDQRKVVVGEPGKETPQLGSPMFQLVANPTWTVPDSIAEEELAGKSDAYFRKNNMTRKNGRIVQEPGPNNSLGEVKFDMKNGEAIYLHDTPAKALFGQNERHRSHGCVRVENALGFARMLAEQNGILDQFNKALATGDETFVKLKSEIPVRLLYHTAFVGSDGKVRFVDDAYGWDNDVAAALGYERKAAKPRAKVPGADVGP